MIKAELARTTFCSLPFTKVILNSWGDVSMCCHQATQIGKLTERSEVLDIWNNPLANQIRQATLNNQLHPVCQSGGNCPFMVSEKKLGNVQFYPKHPTHLEICLPDKHCNVGGESPTDDNPACIMCIRNFRVPQQPDISEFLCKKSLPLMPYLKHLSVMGIAEPFWKDAVFNMLERLEFHKYKHQCSFCTNTNGTCLNESTTKRFFEEVEKSDISWSIDGATAATHRKIRRLDTFDLVVKNLKRWISMKNPNHTVTIYNNINLLNVHEMTMMVEMAHDIGVDSIILVPTHNQTGIVHLGELVLCDKNVDLFKDEAGRAAARSKELGVKLIYPTRFDIVPPPPRQLVQLVPLSVKKN